MNEIIIEILDHFLVLPSLLSLFFDMLNNFLLLGFELFHLTKEFWFNLMLFYMILLQRAYAR